MLFVEGTCFPRVELPSLLLALWIWGSRDCNVPSA